MLKRFIVAFLAFVGLIVPAAFALALLASPASPATPLEPPGCDRNVTDANASVAALQARVKSIGTAQGAKIGPPSRSCTARCA